MRVYNNADHNIFL